MRSQMHHLVLFFIAVFLILIPGPISVNNASAQVRIRIPRPRPEPVSTPSPVTGTTRTSQPVRVDSATPAGSPVNELAPHGIPSSIIIDDGFTYFTLHNKKDYVGGKPLNKG